MAPVKTLSLKARAIGLLANREHSRSELRRKLLRLARAQSLKERQALGDAAAEAADTVAATDLTASVDALLDWLQAQGYLSEARFIESRVNARAPRYGNLRIQQELSQHGVAPDEASRLALKQTELARARLVWQRKFGQLAQDAAGRARQMRFLAGRGFSTDVIRKLVRGDAED